MTVQVSDLRKVFKAPKKAPSLVAVDNVSFGVEMSECFGYLGVNGAGKTTTLRMLTGDEFVTAGAAFIDGKSVLTQQQAVRKVIGYCPQFDAHIGQLTGREHLTLYCKIKGIKQSVLQTYIEDMIIRLGIEECVDRQVHTYSGGNKRRLSLGIALIGNPRVVFLDEPTTGVDPASRRFVWNLIERTLVNRSIILTSHSMEECEALCHRVGIMAKGNLQCIGSLPHLKSKFGNGYKVVITVDDVTKLEQLSAFMTTTFPGSVEIETTGLHLTVQVPKTIQLSEIFRILEEQKESEDLPISSYAVSETTLEQIFIQFAAEAEVEEAPKMAYVEQKNPIEEMKEFLAKLKKKKNAPPEENIA
eukprot:Platyproteum_vivax@DN6504_c0_g1_i1.p1